MRALLLHSNKFETKVILESNLPTGIKPESKKSSSELLEQCLVCFFCIEKNDTDIQIEAFYKDIIKTAKEVGTKNLMISPFVHLSNNLATPSVAKKLCKKLVSKFINTDFNIGTSHFGYHKSLILDIKGHPGSFRYREFY